MLKKIALVMGVVGFATVAMPVLADDASDMQAQMDKISKDKAQLKSDEDKMMQMHKTETAEEIADKQQAMKDKHDKNAKTADMEKMKKDIKANSDEIKAMKDTIKADKKQLKDDQKVLKDMKKKMNRH